MHIQIFVKRSYFELIKIKKEFSVCQGTNLFSYFVYDQSNAASNYCNMTCFTDSYTPKSTSLDPAWLPTIFIRWCHLLCSKPDQRVAVLAISKAPSILGCHLSLSLTTQTQ